MPRRGIAAKQPVKERTHALSRRLRPIAARVDNAFEL